MLAGEPIHDFAVLNRQALGRSGGRDSGSLAPRSEERYTHGDDKTKVTHDREANPDRRGDQE